MPRILIYEECLAAGSAGPLGDEAQQFLPEGLAMTLAVAEDFAKLPGWTVHVLRAGELRTLTPEDVAWQWIDVPGDLDSMLSREAAAADWTLVIAPECGGLLQQRAQAVIDAGGKLLGPGPEFIALAGDKTAVLDRLAAAGIQTPHGCGGKLSCLLELQHRFPVVLKPNDGVGAQNLHLLNDSFALTSSYCNELLLAVAKDEQCKPAPLWRCEEFIPGLAASVAVLCGPGGPIAMRPATQRIVFAEDGHASYQGGAINLDEAEATRAQKLGLAVANALPPTDGYIGIDLILGEAADGSQDTVIEVNPRLTTSYIGLRHATHQSLADAMWRVAQGETVNIAWLQNTVEFTKQGQVTIRDR